MRSNGSAFSNNCFDVWLDRQGNLDWIEFGSEYSCDVKSVLSLVSFLMQRGFVVKQGDSLRLSPSSEGHIASFERVG